MWLPNANKFTDKYHWVELAHYVPSLKKVIREKRNGKAWLVDWRHDVEAYRDSHHNEGIYTSVFHYDSRDIDRATRLGSLFFDLDRDQELSLAHHDVRKLVEYLQDFVPDSAIRVYFSGKKGFHVECEATALGIGPSADLSGVFRFIGAALSDELELRSLDFQVYEPRRMWRLPNSRHQSTGLYKVELDLDLLAATITDVQEYAREPHLGRLVPDQKFSYRANEWFRGWQERKEEGERKQPTFAERIERFNQFGTGLIAGHSTDTQYPFDPKYLQDNCKAIQRLWHEAERDHDLPHEARLFLCSLLSYTEESIKFLHAILANCDDYDPERTQAHVDDWVRRRDRGVGGRPFTCAKANQLGVGCGDCALEPIEKLDRIGDKLVQTGEESDPSPKRFAYPNPKKQKRL